MISMILVDYRTIDKTIEYIKHCQELIKDAQKMHYIIVENYPGNYATDVLQKKYNIKADSFRLKDGEKIYFFYINSTRVLLSVSGNNSGYGKGNNVGARIAEQIYKDDIYIFSNSDLKIVASFKLEEFSQVFQANPQIAIIGPCIQDINGQQQNPRIRLKPFMQLQLYYLNLIMGDRLKNKLRVIDCMKNSGMCEWVLGCFYVVRAKLFWSLGGFDENVFLYGEELIMSRKAEIKGYQTYYYNKISLIHEHDTVNKDVAAEIKQHKTAFKSMLYFYKKYMCLSSFSGYIYTINFCIMIHIYKMEKCLKNILKSKRKRRQCL